MSFKDLTPEQRRAAQEKSAATRRANAEARRNAEASPVEELDVSEPLVLKAEVEDDVFGGLLTDEEKAELRKLAREKARADQKKAVKAAYAKEQLDIARREIGEMPVDEEFRKCMEEEVTLFVEMPRLRKPQGGEHQPEPILIDQKAYVSGRAYKMPRGQAIYMQWLMDQARRHVRTLDGRGSAYYDQQMHQMVHQGGVALGGAGGPTFDSLHKRPL